MEEREAYFLLSAHKNAPYHLSLGKKSPASRSFQTLCGRWMGVPGDLDLMAITKDEWEKSNANFCSSCLHNSNWRTKRTKKRPGSIVLRPAAEQIAEQAGREFHRGIERHQSNRDLSNAPIIATYTILQARVPGKRGTHPVTVHVRFDKATKELIMHTRADGCYDAVQAVPMAKVFSMWAHYCTDTMALRPIMVPMEDAHGA